jgi:hypothetical protein
MQSRPTMSHPGRIQQAINGSIIDTSNQEIVVAQSGTA